MVTKGVASVRSPVCNLQTHGPAVTHERFMRAVELAFREEYDIDVDEPVRGSSYAVAYGKLYLSSPVAGALRAGGRVDARDRGHFQGNGRAARAPRF